MSRRTKAGGAKKRPTRYGAAPTPAELANALRAHRKGSWGEAIDRYRAYLDREPASVDAWMNLGALLALTGRARAAHAAYGQAFVLAPADARVQRDGAIGLGAVGLHQDARAAFERAIALDGSLVGAHLGLSRLCGELGDIAAAKSAALRAAEIAPTDPSAHLEIHRAAFDDRDPGPCIAAAERAVALDPEWTLARSFLAGAMALRGEPTTDTTTAIDFALAQARAGARVFATKREGFTAAIARCELLGPALEFGVRHGVSTRTIAAHVDADVHAFDSFVGLPEPWQGRAAGAFTTAGEPPEVPPSVTLHVGWFEDTLPAFVSSLRQPPRLVHIDSDLYSSAWTALRTLGRWIQPGCVLVFDEYLGNESWHDDEHRAFEEARAAFGWNVTPIAASWITGQAVFEIT